MNNNPMKLIFVDMKTREELDTLLKKDNKAPLSVLLRQLPVYVFRTANKKLIIMIKSNLEYILIKELCDCDSVYGYDCDFVEEFPEIDN